MHEIDDPGIVARFQTPYSKQSRTPVRATQPHNAWAPWTFENWRQSGWSVKLTAHTLYQGYERVGYTVLIPLLPVGLAFQ